MKNENTSNPKRKRYVFSLSLDNEFIKDIDYYAQTTEYVHNSRSQIIEEKLKEVIPQRNLTNTSKNKV